MPQYENLDALLREERKQYRGFSQFLTDEDIYSTWKNDNPSAPAMWGKVDKKLKQPLIDNTSPSAVNTLSNWADYFIDESSPKFLKAAYNQSLTGLTDQFIRGESKYDLGEYDPGVVEDIASTVVSFMFPLDFLSMAVGGWATKPFQGMAMKGLGYKTGEAFAKKGLTKASHRAVIQGISAGGSLAAYEGAVGGVSAAIDGEDITPAIAKGVIHGGILGGISGAAGGGLMAKHAHLFGEVTKSGRIVGKLEGKAWGTEEWIKKGAYGVAGQVGAEAGVFTGAQIPELASTDNLTAGELLKAYAKNVGLFGVLKAKHHMFAESKDFGKKVLKDVTTTDAKTKTGLEHLDSVAEEMAPPTSKAERKVRDGLIEDTIEDYKKILAESSKGKDTFSREELNKFESDVSWLEKLFIDPKTGELKSDAEIEKIYDKVSPQEIARVMETLNKIEVTAKEVAKTAEVDESIGIVRQGFNTSLENHRKDLFDIQRELQLKHKTEDVELKPLIPVKNLKERASVKGKEVDISKQMREIEKIQKISEKKRTEKDIANLEKFQEQATNLIRSAEGIEAKREAEGAYAVSERAEVIEKAYKEGTQIGKEYQDIISKPTKDRTQHEKELLKEIKKKGVDNLFKSVEEKVARLFTLPKESRNFIPEVKDANTRNSLIDYVASGGGATSEIRHIARGLKFLKKNKIDDVTVNDVVNIIKAISGGKFEVGRGEHVVSAFTKYGRWAERKAWVSLKYNPDKLGSGVWGKLRELREAVGEKRKEEVLGAEIPSTIAKKLGELPKFEKSTVEQKEERVASNLYGLEGLGVRTGELNQLTPSHVNKKKIKGKNAYSYEIREENITKGGGNARTIEISKKLYDWIQNIIKEKGIKNNEPIFSKATSEELTSLLPKGIKIEDIRKDIQTHGRDMGLTGEAQWWLAFLTGHKLKETADVFYEKTPTPDKQIQASKIIKDALAGKITAEEANSRIIDLFAGIRKEGASFDFMKFEKEYQLEGESPLPKQDLTGLKRQRDFFLNRLKDVDPEFRIKLEDTLGTHEGQTVVGMLMGHLAKINKGEATIDTIPHEVTHRVTNILKAFGDSGAKKLVKEGIRMFKKKGMSDAQAEEAFVQKVGEYIVNKKMDKPTPKSGGIKRWIQKFWSYLKFKTGLHTERDLTRLMAEQVTTGKLPKVGRMKVEPDIVWYQKKDTWSKLNTEAHKLEETLSNEQINRIRKEIGLPLKGEKKWRDFITEPQIEEYIGKLNEVVSGSSPTVGKVNKIDREYDVSGESRKKYLELLGVVNGDAKNIKNNETINSYEAYVKMGHDKFQSKDGSADYISAINDAGDVSLTGWRRAFTPVYHLLNKYGGDVGKKLSQSLLAHDRLSSIYRGKGDQIIRAIRKLVGKDIKKLRLLDKEVYNDLEKLGKISEKDKAFIKKAENDVESNEHLAWKLYNGAGGKYANEGLTNMYWQWFYKEGKRHMPEVSEKEFKEWMDAKFLENYFTRQVRQDAIPYIDIKSDYINNIVEKNLSSAARNKVKKDIAKKKISKDKLNEEVSKLENDPKFREEVLNTVFDMLHYSHARVQNAYLLPRGVKLPEYISVVKNGRMKNIKVYEDNFGATMEHYVSSMSKYLSTVHHFAGWTGLGREFKLPSAAKAQQVETMLSGRDAKFLGSYAMEALKGQIGLVNNTTEILNRGTYRFTQKIAGTFAATGLSSPLSGIKNFWIGTPRTTATFGLKRTVEGLKQVFKTSAWEEARSLGYAEYGAKTLALSEQGLGSFTMANLFKWNLMTQSEGVNRIASAHAGTLMFAEYQAIYRGETSAFKTRVKKAEVERTFKDVWKLDKSEIDFIKNTNDFTSKANLNKYNQLLVKVAYESHISTQGGTSLARLPLWMSKGAWKPFTLFQRMAYAVTHDTYTNYVKPALTPAEGGSRNFAPLFKAAAGHMVAGAALYGMYDMILDQEPPKSQSSALDKATMYLWRGEFLGVFGEIMSPYERGIGIPIMEPVIIRNTIDAFSALQAVWNKTKTPKQAVGDWSKRAIVIVGQYDRLSKNYASDYYENYKRIRSLKRTFMKEKKYDKTYATSGQQHVTTRQPYYRNLFESVIFGKEEDVAKNYWKAYNFMMTDLEQHGEINVSYNDKKVKQTLKQIIDRRMNPIDLKVTPLVGKAKTREISLRDEFLNWLGKDKRSLAEKLEKDYYYRIRNFERTVLDAKWRDRYSIYPTIDVERYPRGYKGKR